MSNTLLLSNNEQAQPHNPSIQYGSHFSFLYLLIFSALEDIREKWEKYFTFKDNTILPMAPM